MIVVSRLPPNTTSRARQDSSARESRIMPWHGQYAPCRYAVEIRAVPSQQRANRAALGCVSEVRTSGTAVAAEGSLLPAPRPCRPADPRFRPWPALHEDWETGTASPCPVRNSRNASSKVREHCKVPYDLCLHPRDAVRNGSYLARPPLLVDRFERKGARGGGGGGGGVQQLEQHLTSRKGPGP